MSHNALYDRDFFAWTQDQAKALRLVGQAQAGSNQPLDWENLAEEIESMGQRDKRQIVTNLVVVIVHLLKWLYCPELREANRGVCGKSILEHRWWLDKVLDDSPSLRPYVMTSFAEAYGDARDQVIIGTREIPANRYPAAPPFTLEQVLDSAFPADLFK